MGSAKRMVKSDIPYEQRTRVIGAYIAEERPRLPYCIFGTVCRKSNRTTKHEQTCI